MQTFPPPPIKKWQVDVVCGGFPCQDISKAGKGAGIRGPRSGLWSEFARIVRLLRPRFVVVENVAAIINRGLSVVLGDLAACGFDAQWDCLPASAFGAYHERDRAFVVAYRPKRHEPRNLLAASAQRRAQIQSRRLHRLACAQERRERNTRFAREPRLARLVDGVPDRSHRLGALGNAVVPNIAQWLLGWRRDRHAAR